MPPTNVPTITSGAGSTLASASPSKNCSFVSQPPPTASCCKNGIAV